MTNPGEGPFRRVAIVGLGLMGGSLARALKALPVPPHIRAVSLDPRDIEEGVSAGVVDEAPQAHAGLLEDRDLLVYATPLGATVRLMGEHKPFIGSGTIVTDLVSLKGPVLARARGLGLEARYVVSRWRNRLLI